MAIWTRVFTFLRNRFGVGRGRSRYLWPQSRTVHSTQWHFLHISSFFGQMFSETSQAIPSVSVLIWSWTLDWNQGVSPGSAAPVYSQDLLLSLAISTSPVPFRTAGCDIFLDAWPTSPFLLGWAIICWPLWHQDLHSWRDVVRGRQEKSGNPTAVTVGVLPSWWFLKHVHPIPIKQQT